MTSEQGTAQRLLARALGTDRPARLQVRGRCMEPLIRDGDWVEVRPLGPVTEGDVVLAVNGADELVCHRVLARLAAAVTSQRRTRDSSITRRPASSRRPEASPRERRDSR